MADILAAALNSQYSNDLLDEVMRIQHDNRILVINQEIDDCMIEDCILHILAWNRDDRDVPPDKRKPIRIYFNSTGGDSFIASSIINVIENSRTPIWGINLSLVASAAYHIYLSCHKKISLKNGIFLQHDGQVTVSSSGGKAKNTMSFFDQLDEVFKQHVIQSTNMDEEFYDKMYDQEFWFFAPKAKELGVVDWIIGEDCQLEDIL